MNKAEFEKKRDEITGEYWEKCDAFYEKERAEGRAPRGLGEAPPEIKALEGEYWEKIQKLHEEYYGKG